MFWEEGRSVLGAGRSFSALLYSLRLFLSKIFALGIFIVFKSGILRFLTLLFGDCDVVRTFYFKLAFFE